MHRKRSAGDERVYTLRRQSPKKRILRGMPLMSALTSLERTMIVLDHGIPDRVPVALHNFLMACRMIGADFGEALKCGEALAEAQLAAWREFGHDVIMHENGVCAEAEALGCGILYQPAAPPHVEDPVVKSSRRY